MGLVKTTALLLLVFIQSLSCNSDDACLKMCTSQFIVVIDCGSTGTRLNVYEFEVIENNPTFRKYNQTKHKLRLSKFTNDRSDWPTFRRLFRTMRDQALENVPEQCVKTTPIHIQATSGLRQLKDSISRRILDEIRSIFYGNKFIFHAHNVGMLSILNEGMFAWVSVNFITNKFQTVNNYSETFGVLELGGGSTQASFATENPDLLNQTVLFKIFDKEYRVYTVGYDYMGMDMIRLKYANAHNCSRPKCKTQIFFTECYNPKANFTFEYGDKSVVLAGKNIENYYRFSFCVGKGLEFIRPIRPIRQYEDKMQFMMISTFYLTLNTAKNILTETEDKFFSTTVQKILVRSMDICEKPPKYRGKYDHYSCIDTTYLLALLLFAYKFSIQETLFAAVKIGKIKLSWDLGYAIKNL